VGADLVDFYRQGWIAACKRSKRATFSKIANFAPVKKRTGESTPARREWPEPRRQASPSQLPWIGTTRKHRLD